MVTSFHLFLIASFGSCRFASLLCGVTEHCLSGIQSYCPDNVDDIQTVRKSSQISVTVWSTFVFYRLMKKMLVFLFQETLTLTISFFRETGSWMVQLLVWNVTFW